MHTELYHISPSKYYDSIMIDGIVPAMSEGLGRMPGQQWRNEVVWLTHDVRYIMTQHGSPWWMKTKTPIVYTVDVVGLDIRRRSEPTYFNDLKEDVEFLHYGVIRPDRILKIDRELYKAIQ